jgi:hypothetical protein
VSGRGLNFGIFLHSANYYCLPTEQTKNAGALACNALIFILYPFKCVSATMSH